STRRQKGRDLDSSTAYLGDHVGPRIERGHDVERRRLRGASLGEGNCTSGRQEDQRKTTEPSATVLRTRYHWYEISRRVEDCQRPAERYSVSSGERTSTDDVEAALLPRRRHAER